MRRQVRTGWSAGRPSRRKNEPGIFPAAYMRSSTSTVSGKKSIPSRTRRSAFAVTSATVSPMRATTAPCDCGASLPVSNDSVLDVPLMGADTEMASAIVSPVLRLLTAPPVGRRAGQFPVVRHPSGPGTWQLAAGGRAAAACSCQARCCLSNTVLLDEECGCGTSGPCGPLAMVLLPQTEAGDECPVALDVVVLDVVEEAATAPHEHQQAAPAVMVLLVVSKVFGEVVDAFGEERHLHLGRPGVGGVGAMRPDRGGLVRQGLHGAWATCD